MEAKAGSRISWHLLNWRSGPYGKDMARRLDRRLRLCFRAERSAARMRRGRATNESMPSLIASAGTYSHRSRVCHRNQVADGCVRNLQKKMQEHIADGVDLGWLIHPDRREVKI